MKKVACIIFEVDDNVDVETIARNVEQSFNLKIVAAQAKFEVLPWREKTQILLAHLGVNSYLMGYRFLLLCMEYVSTTDRNQKLWASDVYGYVSEKTGIAYVNVERNIRKIREKIYELNSPEKIESVLGIKDDGTNMPNMKFIAALADRVFGI